MAAMIEMSSTSNLNSSSNHTLQEVEPAQLQRTPTALKDDFSVLSWHGITVTLKDGTKILDGASGFAKAGEMVAILGPSGCGKTTLLNFLSNRTPSSAGVDFTGTVRANGKPTERKALRSISAYVEQEDALIGALTVHETISFASRLSPSPSTAQRGERGERVRSLTRSFGLSSQASNRVGTPLQKGLSGGQKRRLSVASELVTSPRILFLDEPTSGLDSFASFEVISLLKAFAVRNNMAVVTSIHQPSTATFNLFDRLVVLSKGGTVYSGPTGEVMRGYFGSVGRGFPGMENPAEYLLELTNTDFGTGQEVTDVVGELREKWNSGDEAKPLREEIDKYQIETTAKETWQNTETANTNDPTRQARQILVLLHRLAIKSFRDVLAYQIRLAMYIGFAILVGTVWLRLSNSQSSIQPLINGLFFSSAFMSFMAVAYVPAYLEDHATYAKESGNGLYGPGVFLISNFIIGIPFIFSIALTFSLTTYFLVNYHHGAVHFFTYTLLLFLDLLAAESLVVLISSAFPVFVVSLAVTAFANGLWMSVSGYLVPPNVINKFWYYTFYWIDYQRYVFQGMLFNEFQGKVFDCEVRNGEEAGGCYCMYRSELQGSCKIDGKGVLKELGYGERKYGLWIGVLLVVMVTMRFAAWVVLRMRR